VQSRRSKRRDFFCSTAFFESDDSGSSADRAAQGGNGLRWSQADHKLIIVPAADHRSVAGILADPDYALGIYEDFPAVDVLKQYEFHVAPFSCDFRT
jgi:hypothetical protein